MKPGRRPGLFPVMLMCPGMVLARTKWPEFMRTPDPGLSVGPLEFVLPADVVAETPTAKSPQEEANWSGKWSGWACRDQVDDTRPVAEKSSAERATIVCAFAAQSVKPYVARLHARIVEQGLQAPSAGSAGRQ